MSELTTATPTLKRGQTVQVYYDPVDCKHHEGSAELLRCEIDRPDESMAYWKVRFISDGMKVSRWINRENH